MAEQEQGPNPKKAAGGRARARALSAEDRSAIARRAALSRHGLHRAIAEGSIIIDGVVRIPCAVLDDANNTRVLTQEGFLGAIGRAGKAKGGEGATVDGLPAFLRAANLKPFISKDLIASTTPIEFVPLRGPGYQGYRTKLRLRLMERLAIRAFLARASSSATEEGQSSLLSLSDLETLIERECAKLGEFFASVVDDVADQVILTELTAEVAGKVKDVARSVSRDLQKP